MEVAVACIFIGKIGENAAEIVICGSFLLVLLYMRIPLILIEVSSDVGTSYVYVKDKCVVNDALTSAYVYICVSVTR